MQGEQIIEHGYIAVKVRTAGGALPVENAVVTIKDSEGRILSLSFTDRSGMARTVKVLAPEKRGSSHPESKLPAFFSYSIDTDKEGYWSVRNILVPVYPGITSVQTVELTPLAEGQKNTPVIYNEGFAPDL